MTTNHRRQAKTPLLIAAAIPMLLLFAAACTSQTYVVLQVSGTSVTCGAHDNPAKTFTREWDPIVQIAPEIGQPWLCNE